MEKETTALLVLCSLLLADIKTTSATDRSLTRDFEPVVLYGRELTPYIGTPKDQLFLFAYTDGIWKEIPFQLDKRNASGGYQNAKSRELNFI